MESCEGLEEVLLVEDTTELNLTSHQHRIGEREGLGILNNQYESVGFFCHPTLAVNPQDRSLLYSFLPGGAGLWWVGKKFWRYSVGAAGGEGRNGPNASGFPADGDSLGPLGPRLR
ncbi:hypothetical protein AGMMS49940_13760 [Spirochaetia bacterium]|nr:hypothetical protein AGMMS49940_13760 [Spirochaetia bacterium]